ncbi:hypothetical protein [Caldimonas tepidiphila]|uniref:hypothetical protein n=1 Tax=Caldimonas tepidiphila TaxID=2315841 RepID=UPI000E5B31FC|nr:hypothetical protein [Caldimonas tepidiphila]
MGTLALSSDAGDGGPRKELVQVGETFGRTVRYGADEIAAFAASCHDGSPLQSATGAEGSDGTTASCAHTSSMLIGLAASHLSRRNDGLARRMTGLNFNFAFKAPIHADEDIHLQWKVASVQWSARLGGYLVQLDGNAATLRSGVALVARGTVLVKEAP